MTKKLQRLVAMFLCSQIINKCNYRCKIIMNDLKIIIHSQCGLKNDTSVQKSSYLELLWQDLKKSYYYIH